MRLVTFPNGETRPALGLGTWRMGESRVSAKAEQDALRLALDIGYRVFDSAEMYGDGGAETLLGQALAGAMRSGAVRREELFIVTKVYPHNASTKGVLAACERSLRRLQLDQVDLYLLHWPGEHPLAKTLAGFEAAQQRGWVHHWGVSNFDLAEMQELTALPGGQACAANQVYYSPRERGVEFDLLPWQQARQMPLMAYCPIDAGALAAHRGFNEIAQRLNATPAQLALATLMARGGVMPIPKAVNPQHLRDNFAAAELDVDATTLSALDSLFPRPTRKRVLKMS